MAQPDAPRQGLEGEARERLIVRGSQLLPPSSVANSLSVFWLHWPPQNPVALTEHLAHTSLHCGRPCKLLEDRLGLTVHSSSGLPAHCSHMIGALIK